MDLLLDTHALFWAIYNPPSLSAAAVGTLSDPANAVYATLASAQEIAIKLGVGRWRASLDLLLHFDARVDEAGYGLVVPVALDYANTLRLPDIPDHRDPFDRLIVAQALAREMTLVSSDPFAPLYGGPVIPAGRGGRPNDPRGGRLVPTQPLAPLTHGKR